jgi:hypothetical protein
MIRRISLLLSVSLLAFSLDGAHASRNAQTFLDVETRPFTEQAAQIRQDLAAGDKYSEIKDSDRRDVIELLGRMEAQLSAAGGIDALGPGARVQLYNDQERVNAILTGARADSRLICRRAQVTGSHRKRQTCATVAEIERRRQSDQETMLSTQRYTPCLGVGGNSPSGGCATPGL